jgi:hypothetical protein
MYYEKFFPFYVAYANPMMYDGEKVQENELERMKAYYPKTARAIQEEVEKQCDLMDYEGSRIYDEYPDRLMLREMSRGIRRKMEPQLESCEAPAGLLDDLIEVLLYQEIWGRRCRRQRCRRYFA